MEDAWQAKLYTFSLIQVQQHRGHAILNANGNSQSSRVSS